MYGIFSFFAARQTDIQIYPPVPITISGLKYFNIFLASVIECNVLANLFIFLKLNSLDIPYESIVFNSYPALGTKFTSSPLGVPINIILELGSSFIILLAIAIPGFICPPVPAAAITTFIKTSLFYIGDGPF